MLFFTNQGKVYWHKVYGIPELGRDRRGRAIVNLLNLAEGEQVTDCRAVREFDKPDHYLVMATRRGLVKKTELAAFSRPKRYGIIAIKLREGDELVDVAVTRPGDELVLATSRGMAIRFRESDARTMGRNSTGVKGIRLFGDDTVVGMVVADPEACLLTVCANGYGKRTPFGPNLGPDVGGETPQAQAVADDGTEDADESEPEETDAEPDAENGENGENHSSQRSYRTQNRGGKGLHDIKTTERNGPVIGIVRVRDNDELMMITARGKIQRLPVNDISIIGRNTQGVRIMSLDEGDTVVAAKRVPREEEG
jgi:DNA gyrase subunit A